MDETEDLKLELEDDADPIAAEIEIEPEAAEYDENASNLVPHFMASEDGKEFLQKLAVRVIKECDAAVENSEPLREERKNVWETLAGRKKRTNGHWENCADPKTYLAFERTHRLSSRFFVEIFAANPNIFIVNKNGPDDADHKLLTEHSNWQWREEITDFLAHQRRGLMIYTALGSAFFKSGRDFTRGRNRHTTLGSDDLILPFAYTAVEVDLSDMPWKAEVLRLYRDEVETRGENIADDGLPEFANLDLVLERADAVDDDPIEDSERLSMGALTGLMPDEGGKESAASPFFFLCYSGTAKFPGSKSSTPITITLHPRTKAVVALSVRMEEDWKDRSRFDQQTQQLELYTQALEQYQAVSNEHAMAMGEWQQEASMAAQFGAPMMTPEPQLPDMMPPPPPSWLAESIDGQPAPVKMSPLELYTRADFVPNIPDMFGVGFGNMLCALEDTANTALAHYLDAAEFGNSSMIVTTENSMPKKDPKFAPGTILRLQNTDASQLSNAFKELRPTNANPQLMEMARFLGEIADSSIAAPSVLSGQPGKSGETAEGITLRAELAAKQMTAGALTYISGLSNLARNNAKLNAKFMKDEEIFRVSGAESTQKRIKRSMYQRDFAVSFTADTRLIGQSQRIAEKDQLVAMAGSIPPLQQNAAFMYSVIRGALEARGELELVNALGPRPADPTVPFMTPPPPPPGMPPGGAPPAKGGPPQPPQG